MLSKFSENLEIIKYLINDLHMNINHKYNNNNLLIFACGYNKNINIVIFFLEIIRLNVQDFDPYKFYYINRTYLIYFQNTFIRNIIYLRKINYKVKMLLNK